MIHRVWEAYQVFCVAAVTIYATVIVAFAVYAFWRIATKGDE